MAPSGWCIDKLHDDPVTGERLCLWDSCDCWCHKPQGLIKPTKKRPVKRKGRK